MLNRDELIKECKILEKFNFLDDINFSNKYEIFKKYKYRDLLKIVKTYGLKIITYLDKKDFDKLMKNYLVDKEIYNNTIIENIYFVENRETFELKLIIGKYDKHKFDKNKYRFIVEFRNVKRKDFYIYKQRAELLSRRMYSENKDDDKRNEEIIKSYRRLFGLEDNDKCQDIRIIT